MGDDAPCGQVINTCSAIIDDAVQINETLTSLLTNSHNEVAAKWRYFEVRQVNHNVQPVYLPMIGLRVFISLMVVYAVSQGVTPLGGFIYANGQN